MSKVNQNVGVSSLIVVNLHVFLVALDVISLDQAGNALLDLARLQNKRMNNKPATKQQQADAPIQGT